MVLNRYGEDNYTAFRNRRLFSENGQWYFDTREGKLFGPYRDQNEAKKALAIFIAKSLLDLNVEYPRNFSHPPGEQDNIESMVEELLKLFRYRIKNGETSVLAWANHRLKELKENSVSISNSKERIEVLKYALEQEYPSL